jgi:hypothetical protein
MTVATQRLLDAHIEMKGLMMSSTTPGAPYPLNDRPDTTTAPQVSNARMVEKIAALPFEPYQEGRYVLRVVEIRGRQSGKTHTVPLAVVTTGGCQYLVSPSSARNWAANLAAAGRCTLRSSQGSIDVEATRVLTEDAIPVLRTYVGQLRWAAEQFPFTADAPDVTIGARLGDVAVFRLAPRVSEPS